MSYISDKYKISPDTVMRMSKDGVIDWRVNYLHEFWIFYHELLKQNQELRVRLPVKETKEEIKLHYRISERSFYRWVKVCKKLFANDMAHFSEN